MSVTSSGTSLDARHPALGAWLYVSSLQYFVVQLLVALQWSPPYSVRRDTISDLGNTACGRFSGRYVCSPLHQLMNVSFLVLGVTMIVGTALIASSFVERRVSWWALAALAVGGVGVVLVGVFPENSVAALHGFGAALPFLVGNAGLVVLGLSLRTSRTLGAFTTLVGALSLVALAFYATGHYGGLGEGGVERIVAYPQTIWFVTFGVVRLTRRRLNAH